MVSGKKNLAGDRTALGSDQINFREAKCWKWKKGHRDHKEKRLWAKCGL